jgi:hypothetical protein
VGGFGIEGSPYTFAPDRHNSARFSPAPKLQSNGTATLSFRQDWLNFREYCSKKAAPPYLAIAINSVESEILEERLEELMPKGRRWNSFRPITLQSESMSLKAGINKLNIGLSTVTGIAGHRTALWEVDTLDRDHMPYARDNFPHPT